MRLVMVICTGEGIQEGLQLAEGGGLGVLGAEPFLGGLLEALDLALGLWVIRLAVLLPDAQAAQLEAVAAALAAGQPGGEHHVGERRGRDVVSGHGRGTAPARWATGRFSTVTAVMTRRPFDIPGASRPPGRSSCRHAGHRLSSMS